jgi:S-adenosyl methyltransferase
MEPGFAAAEIDTSKPHPARMYNAYLGGNNNYPADRAAVRQILHTFPEVRGIALANRAFLQRAVRFLAAEVPDRRRRRQAPVARHRQHRGQIVNIEDKRAREREARRRETGKRSDQPQRLIEGQRVMGWREALNELDRVYPGRIRWNTA